MTLLLSIYCALIVLASLAGGWLPMVVRLTHTRLQVAISFVAGLMLGVGILHLAPHAWEQLRSADRTMAWLLAGFMAMFFAQRYSRFHHHDVPEEAPEQEHHREEAVGDAHSHSHSHAHSQPHPHPHPALTLADESARQLSWLGAACGLTIHTLLDGLALAGSVELDRRAGAGGGLLGLGTFLVIFLHKPFDALAVGTLLTVGRTTRSLRHWVNGLFALANPAGVLLFYLGVGRFAGTEPQVIGAVLAFTAGTFLSIATSDLLPELQFHAHDRGKLSLALLAGIGVSVLLGAVEPTGHGPDPASAPGALRSEGGSSWRPPDGSR